ncbi:unnamed protein product [Ambrosiozyma monospora]|uniref:Unnamed protein product n=1 Tax=Ambrosiozyma monospora TaxID=43982 RepID=A0ACB5T5V1_AMBMO|nr:unnamed protein product [Ambrosiozyma monospora]
MFLSLSTTDFGATAETGEEDRLVQVGQHWNLILKPCKIYNESSEIFNDCKILNHYLNLKLSEIISLNKIKENVWLRSFNDINELYYNNFNFSEDAGALANVSFQGELIKLVNNSIAILKLVFFKPSSDALGDVCGSAMSSRENSILKLNDFYNHQRRKDSTTSGDAANDEGNDQLSKMLNIDFQDDDDSGIGRINLNVLHKLSLDSQILFDVILVIVKFLTNYENIFKMKMKFNSFGGLDGVSGFGFGGSGGFSLLQHFELSSMIFNNDSTNNNNGESGSDNDKMSEFDELLFTSYLKFFKIYLNLEQFLKSNYNYHDFTTSSASTATEFTSQTISNIINRDRQHYTQVEQNLNSILTDDLNGALRSKDIIVSELYQFKLPFKFLKIGSFLFNFIYDRNFKFVNFKHLSDVLFHLRIFMENKDEEYV